MPYAQWHYPFENKEKIDQNKDFQLILLLKVWIKPVDGFIPATHWYLLIK
jgi:hypothetical protein